MLIDRTMRRIPGIAWRTLWRSVVGLLVFAQVAVAAQQCVPAPGEQQVISGVAGVHHGLDEHCLTGLVPAAQAPATEPKRVAPDVGAVAPPAWSPAPDAATPPASLTRVHAGPSLRLQFRNLRL